MKNFQLIDLNPHIPLLKNRVFWLVIIILAVIVVTFWSQSRVPALNEKAQMADRINISAIAFDVVLPVNDSQPLYERTYKSSINWAYTNWKGMLFGFLVAATFITLLQILPDVRSGKNRYVNSFLGLAMGSPLGVCVNCATPIAQGMIHGGAKLETSLSLLMSSPTLNPIVITIALSLLSFHIVVIKILLSVVFILFVIPLLVKLYLSSEVISDTSKQKNTVEIDKNISNIMPEANDFKLVSQQQLSWASSLMIVMISIFKNLIYVLKITLPLMILAGLAGSFLIQVLPSGSLSDLTVTPENLFIMAAIGVFLPVPIAFDVLIVNLLILSGLDTGLAASLLFSLGIFSIYPALLIAKTQSIKLSLLIVVSVMLFSVAAGGITSLVDDEVNLQAKYSIEQGLESESYTISFDDVFNTCEVFVSVGTKKSCFQRFLSSDVFPRTVPDICFLKEADNINHKDSDAAISICKQLILFINVKKLAKDEQDMETCETLRSDALADECKVGVIRTGSLEYNSLDRCNQIKGITRQRYCRSYVLADRMSLKSAETCNVGLSEDMLRQCNDNLDAHITSELGEIDKCNELNTNNAKSICRSTVVSLKISSLQEYSVCSQLILTEEIKRCNDLVIIQESLQNKNMQSCNALSSKVLIEQCRVSVAIRDMTTTIENKNLSQFSVNSVTSRGSFSKQHGQNKIINVINHDMDWSEIYNDKRVSVAFIEHRNREIEKGTVFRKLPPDLHGLQSVWKFDLTDFMEPFKYGKGVASGDFNNDGWPDLVFASSNGFKLYANNGADNTEGVFKYIASISFKNTSINSFLVSFVDIDNDGWQDVFVSAYAEGNFIFKNHNGLFSSDRVYRLKNEKSVLTLSAGFSDWDKDGDLDIVTGNWTYGAEGAFIPAKSQNIWYKNNSMEFESLMPDEPPGETLSILMSDLNGDNNIDMLVGNDRKYPDILYYGNSAGDFKQITKDMKYIKETSLNTMSYDSADFTNDLLLDIFSTDMSVAAGKSRYYCEFLDSSDDKSHCERLLKAYVALQSLDVAWCASVKGNERVECYTAMAIKLAKRNKDSELCKKVSRYFAGKEQLCYLISQKINSITSHNEGQQLEQKESNKILINIGNGRFVDATEKMQISNSYWSWTGKAADLDNDEWQDIYVGNGLGFGQSDKNIHSNVFYHNQKGVSFNRAETEFGLTNYTNTPGYTYTDFDLDGDIDIITADVMSSPSVFINQATTANSVSFVLRDDLANKFCIGCKVIIHYDNNTKNQIRELKLSGGFMSFDDPVIYFGLSDYENINSVVVIWSDGKSWQLNEDLPVNRRYKISRH